MPKRSDYSASAYEAHKESMREKSAENSKASREIADTCPKCKDESVRERCNVDLKFALETLFPTTFNLAWGSDQISFIKDIERTFAGGDMLCRAMPRGSGKTAILVASFVVAIVTGQHKFAVLIGATAEAATELLEDVKNYLETNDDLYAYFPEIIHPIRSLEGVYQRKLLWNGEVIKQNFKSHRIIMPSHPDVAGASAIIRVVGLLGRVRGMHYVRPSDGENARPTLALIDDPQNDETAISPIQCDKREKVMCGTVPGLAGPGKKCAVLAAVTVIAADDVADRLLDRKKHPEWHGTKTVMLRSVPTNVDLWNQYAEILRECQRSDEPILRATAFYRENREAMDAGGEASWPERFDPGHASAIETAMSIKLENPSRFASEYQNQPLVLIETGQQTDADKVVLRLSGHARGVIPIEVETVVAGVDVQKNYLVYTVGGFSTDATPSIVDYGTFPKQNTQHFDRRTASRTIELAFPKMDPDAQLWAAIEGLIVLLTANEYKRQDGLKMHLKRIAIDVRYKGQVIKKFVRQSTRKDILLPAQGIHFAPGSPGINDREAKAGEVSKNGYRLPPLAAGQIARTASFDSSDYIGIVHDALNTPKGAKGALTLFNAEPHLHRNFADQLCSEYSTMVEAKGRKKRVWTLKPNGGDNDFLDSTKLMFLAAYVSGVEPSYLPRAATKPAQQAKRAPVFASI